MMFSARVSSYNGQAMLNICDANLLGRALTEDGLSIHINPVYYGGEMVGNQKAEELLLSSSIINMAGEKIVSLSTSVGVGVRSGTKMVDGIPFLIVLKM